MDKNKLRKMLNDYRSIEERSIVWIAKKTNICQVSLYKFASGERQGMSEENLYRLEKFLEKWEGGEK